MKLDEKELIQGLRKGSNEAFELLIETYQKKVFTIAYAITLDKEESLEISQDVFVSIYEHIDTFREDSGLFTWIRKITINLCLNWKKKWIRRLKWNHQSIEDNSNISPALDTAEFYEKTDNPEDQYIAYEEEKLIMAKIAQLPEKVRSVLVLKIFEKLSYEDIAKTLGINIGTVKSRIHYAKQFLTKSIY